MQAARLFRNIWRANALVILAAGVLSLCVVAVSGYYALRQAMRQREVRAVVNTDAEHRIEESLSLRSATQIAGHPWVLVPLESDQTYDQEYFSKSAVAARNYAFVSRAVEIRWLYPHSRFLIVDNSQLPAAEYDSEDEVTALISFEVVQQDSDGNKRLTSADSSELVFVRPDGTGSTTVLNKVRTIVSQELLGEEVLVIYEDEEGYAAATFSLKDFSQLKIERMELPPVGS